MLKLYVSFEDQSFNSWPRPERPLPVLGQLVLPVQSLEQQLERRTSWRLLRSLEVVKPLGPPSRPSKANRWTPTAQQNNEEQRILLGSA